MKKFGTIDIVVSLAVIFAIVIGFLTYAHFRATADKQIESTSKIVFDVFLRGVTITSGSNPIRRGDETFITIRNVPYTKLEVLNSQIMTKKLVLPNKATKPAFVIVDDYSQLFMYDIIVSVVDTAQITKDGPVIGGNKIKMGMPITLEGLDYKFNGTVSNIQMFEQSTPAKNNIEGVTPLDAPKESPKTTVKKQAPKETFQPRKKTKKATNPVKLK